MSEDYAPNLAQALSVVNSEQPHFSVQKSSLQRRTQPPPLPTVEDTPATTFATNGPSFTNLSNTQANTRSSLTVLGNRQAPQKKPSVLGKRGRLPGRPAVPTQDGPSKLGSAGSTTAPAGELPAKVNQSTSSPPQDPPRPPSPSKLPQTSPTSPNNSQSASTSQDGTIDQLKPTLRRFKSRIDELNRKNQSLEKELKDRDAHWDGRFQTLETELKTLKLQYDELKVQHTAFEISSRSESHRKDGEINLIRTGLKDTVDRLNAERQTQGQMYERLRDDLARFIRNVDGPVHQLARDVAQRTAENEVGRRSEALQKAMQSVQSESSTGELNLVRTLSEALLVSLDLG